MIRSFIHNLAHALSIGHRSDSLFVEPDMGLNCVGRLGDCSCFVCMDSVGKSKCHVQTRDAAGIGLKG